jgi:hypothetical protein
MPADGKATASLVCGEKENYPGEFKKTADKQATLTFDGLLVKSFADKTCNKLVVLVDKKEAFNADAADLVIKAPVKGKALTFPVDASKRYTLKASVPADNLDVEAEVGADCMHYDNTAKKCTDRAEVKLPVAKAYVVAKVEGKLSTGVPVTYYMAAGETGIGLVSAPSLGLAAANAVLAKDASAEAKKAFHFYKESAAAKLMGATFDDAALKAADADIDALADMAVVKLLNLAVVSVHGFHAVSAEELNKVKEHATWIAAVKATPKKAGDKEQSFVVAGSDKYFHSMKPLIVADKPVYLDESAFLADVAQASVTDHFRVYAAKGMTLAPAACKLEDLTVAAAAKTSDALQPAPTTDTAAVLDPDMEACEVQMDAVKALGLENYTLSFGYQAWDWFEVK